MTMTLSDPPTAPSPFSFESLEALVSPALW